MLARCDSGRWVTHECLFLASGENWVDDLVAHCFWEEANTPGGRMSCSCLSRRDSGNCTKMKIWACGSEMMLLLGTAK